MVYRLVTKYENDINSFAINDRNKLLIATNNKVIDLDSRRELIESDIAFQELYCKDSRFFINTLYGKGYLFDSALEPSFLNEYIFTIYNDFIISSKKIDEERFTIIKNIEKENEKFEIKDSSTVYFINEQNFFRKNFRDNSIECFSFPKGTFLWQFHLSLVGKYKSESSNEQNHEVNQIVGVYKDILWLYLNSKEFIGISVHSGELEHRILGINKANLVGNVDSYIDTEDQYVFYDTEYIIDENNGKIIGLKADRYFEIDLNNQQIEPKLFGLLDKMERVFIDKNDISSRNVLMEDYLYFYMYNNLKFGVLDVKTKEIVFVSGNIDTIITEKGQQIKDMQVSNNRVYLLESGGTLYLFEKE